MSSVAPLVTADWLKHNIDAPDVRVVDATWVLPSSADTKSGREQYNDAHIPGAFFFDIDHIADPDHEMAHMLPDPILFSSRVRRLGLGDGNRIIVYDQNSFYASARVWWMFRAMGHKDVKVLDGGMAAWLEADGDTEDLPPVSIERHYTARKRADLIKNMTQMREQIEHSQFTVLDARGKGRFDGTEPDPRPNMLSGHIPGSQSVPATTLINEDGTLKSAEKLKNLLGDHVSKQVIATCGSGVSAAIIALSLARLGNWDVALYDGSWTEWASNPENPIATL
ncbi:MAG: sulfurtransferase [Henriciella sp.]|jgi:thiosulfate/3-mercaptopyruvate sulfurtransferase